MILATPAQEAVLLILAEECPLHTRTGTSLEPTFTLIRDWANDEEVHYAITVIAGLEDI